MLPLHVCVFKFVFDVTQKKSINDNRRREIVGGPGLLLVENLPYLWGTWNSSIASSPPPTWENLKISKELQRVGMTHF